MTVSDAASSIDPTISIVIPCRNEEENVIGIANAVIQQLEQIEETFELIFIDNASQDRTVELVKAMCARDPRIKLIVNARNFGQLRSPAHAIYAARGQAVISMCADFQDPPEMIPDFVRRWRAGTELVLAVRQAEKTPLLLRTWRSASYAIAARFGDYPILPNATGFGIYDRKVIRATASLNEPEPFLRGMFLETGYRLETVPFIRPPRAGGTSNNNFFTLLDFALSSLAAASKKMLRAPFYIGAAMGLLGMVTLVAGLVALALGRPAIGWFVATAIEAQFALIFVTLGLIGDQVRVISDRTRGTPLVVERERVNFAPEG